MSFRPSFLTPPSPALAMLDYCSVGSWAGQGLAVGGGDVAVLARS